MDKELMKDLFELRKKGMEVFDKYEDQIVGFLRKEKVTAEESLQRDLLFEMYQYGNTLFDLIDRKASSTGTRKAISALMER